MRLTIGFRNKATLRTGARGISGVNQHCYYTCEPGFIHNKEPQLTESPRVLLSPLSFPNRDAVSDVGEVFKGDSPTAVFGLCNNTLGNHVVGVGSESLLLPGTLFKKSLGLFGTIGLKFSTQFGMALSHAVHLPSRVGLAVRIGSDINNAQVNTQKAIRYIGRWLRGINHSCQIKDAIAENEVGLSNLPINPHFLICSYSNRDNLPAVKSKNGDLIQSLPGENALVIDHSRMRIEEVLRFSIHLVALRNFGYRSHCHLSRKFVVLAKVIIGEVMKVILPECATFKSNLGCVIAGFVKPLHRLKESLMLLWARSKLYHQSLFHTFIVDYIVLYVKSLLKGGSPAFLCQLKQTVSCGYSQ